MALKFFDIPLIERMKSMFPPPLDLQKAEEEMLCQFPSLGLKKPAASTSCPLGHSLLWDG